MRDEDGGGSRQPSWWRGCVLVNCGDDGVAIVVDDRCGDEGDERWRRMMMVVTRGWEVMVWWVLVDDVCGDDDMEMKVGGGVACQCGRRQAAGKRLGGAGYYERGEGRVKGYVCV
ncbi:hypothetical protein Tco_1108590 [Tanacetum coccineum]